MGKQVDDFARLVGAAVVAFEIGFQFGTLEPLDDMTL